MEIYTDLHSNLSGNDDNNVCAHKTVSNVTYSVQSSDVGQGLVSWLHVITEQCRNMCQEPIVM